MGLLHALLFCEYMYMFLIFFFIIINSSSVNPPGIKLKARNEKGERRKKSWSTELNECKLPSNTPDWQLPKKLPALCSGKI